MPPVAIHGYYTDGKSVLEDVVMFMRYYSVAVTSLT